ncbi:MAG: peptidyl-prolyl cis-trans isomerase [Pseudobutyrivibrio sp.]|nr:peptidyl-prolyl cis-trans isomerase [Pseudobutyrivibrio sp.]
MRFFKKILALSLITAAMLSLTACTYQGKTVYFDTPSGGSTVFKISDLKCSKKEASLYLMNAKNIYGTVNDVNLWADEFNTDTMTESIKDNVMEHLTRVYVLNLYAMENEIALTETEEDKCQEAAREYYQSLNEVEKDFCGAKEKDVFEMYKKYALAEKVYSQLMNSVDEEVSEDEARVMEAYVLFVTDPAEAKEVQDKIDYGNTFVRLAATYTELDTYQVTFARKEYPEEVDDVVFNLDTDEVSPAIEADGGYYYFQCIDKYNEELSEENKMIIIDKRRKQVIDDIIVDLEGKYFSDMNVKLWDSMEIPAESVDEITTSTFFVTLSNYIDF